MGLNNMWKTDNLLDYKPIEDIIAVQETALQNQIAYLYANSAYYKSLFDTHKIDPSSIKSIADLIQIPTTSKKDLGENNNDFVCVPKVDIIEYVTTSGTLGEPIIIALTKNDLDRLAYNEKRSLEIAGITNKDTIQITTTLDKLFMAGMAYYTGAVSLGATVIRTGIGNPGSQWASIKQFKPTATIAVPSFLYKLASYASAHNIRPNKSSITKAICIGEPIRNSDFTPNTLNKKLTSKWPIDLFSTYASTEMMTAFTECEAQNGGHLLPELVVIEILNNEGSPVKSGELGEVTITPLGVEGTPVLRYRTGDLARSHTQPCTCGRHTLRLGPMEARKNQMIKLKGTTIFPQSIEEILMAFDQIEHYVIEISSSAVNTDIIRIYLSDELNDAFIKALQSQFSDTLRVTPNISTISNTALKSMLHPEGARKPKKIIDIRANLVDE